MPKTLVKGGEEYLPSVKLPELKEMYRRECPGKSKVKLQTAVLRKQNRTLKNTPSIKYVT